MPPVGINRVKWHLLFFFFLPPTSPSCLCWCCSWSLWPGAAACGDADRGCPSPCVHPSPRQPPGWSSRSPETWLQLLQMQRSAAWCIQESKCPWSFHRHLDGEAACRSCDVAVRNSKQRKQPEQKMLSVWREDTSILLALGRKATILHRDAMQCPLCSSLAIWELHGASQVTDPGSLLWHGKLSGNSRKKGEADSQRCKGKGEKASSCHCKSQSLFRSTDGSSCEQHSAWVHKHKDAKESISQCSQTCPKRKLLVSVHKTWRYLLGLSL